MTVGIVGHEQAKFTPATEAEARRLIRRIFARTQATKVVSGECRLGGVDIFAREAAEAAGIPFEGFPPLSDDWETGFRPRNIQIAEASAVVYSIVVDRLPDGYAGRRFPLCYHCGETDHVKSGGCWTVKYARSIGKRGHVLVIRTDA
jgi:hypothetical protein